MWLQSLVGTRQKVLAEKGGKGHSENFAPVRLPLGAEVGKIVDVNVTGFENSMLIGEPA
jgi:threonylcarbamoyladenosine tRNA methylthiotransferase MtaB